MVSQYSKFIIFGSFYIIIILNDKIKLNRLVFKMHSPTYKLQISIDLLALVTYNADNPKYPVFHYIKDVLKQHNLSPIEAREILLDMQGAFSPDTNKFILRPIIEYLEQIYLPPKAQPADYKSTHNHYVGAIKYSKLDFTPDELRPTILKLANLKGFDSPIPYLDELLKQVQTFNDNDFTCTFYLNVHHVCQENADKFWSVSHREEITKWLKNAPIMTDVFDTTWTTSPTEQLTPAKNEQVSLKLSLRQIALLYIYQNKLIQNYQGDEVARRYGHQSGGKLIQHYNRLLKSSDRINVDGKAIKPLIKDIESVLPHLKPEEKKRPNDELVIIRKKIS